LSYDTSVDGQFTITPPLTWAEIRTSPAPTKQDGNFDVSLDVTEETVDTDDGQTIRKTAAALIPGWVGRGTFYHLVEHVQAVIDAHPGHQFTGYFECDGEDTGDLWRVVIRDGKAIRVEPRIVWPDEADAELDAWKHEAQLLRGITRQARLIVRDVPSAEQAIVELRELLNP
jgi:hypothetical protein